MCKTTVDEMQISSVLGVRPFQDLVGELVNLEHGKACDLSTLGSCARRFLEMHLYWFNSTMGSLGFGLPVMACAWVGIEHRGLRVFMRKLMPDVDAMEKFHSPPK